MQYGIDIHTGVTVAVGISILSAILSFFTGIQLIRKGRTLKFFRMRREHMVRGWRRIFTAIILVLVALVLNQFAEPFAYQFFPPSPTPSQSPTPSLSPTITQTPTISLTPTITDTPSETYTPTITPTPHMPLAVQSYFEGTLTPPADFVFSALEFSAIGVDENYNPIQPSDVFTNPLKSMYAIFSYDGMVNGIQWTALWYRNGELVHFETLPWDGGSGGYGLTEWSPDPQEWLPGVYEVQLFVGMDWVSVGRFTVRGEPPTATPTKSSTPSPSSTPTPSPSATSGPSPTHTLSLTPTSTFTSTITPTQPTSTPSNTPIPSNTRAPTATPITPSPTNTRAPTNTPAPPTPTNTRAPTATAVQP